MLFPAQVLEDLEDNKTESVTHPSLYRHHFSTNSKIPLHDTDHDYTAHLRRPGGTTGKHMSSRYYTPDTSDVSSTTSDNEESVHLPDPPKLSKELLNTDGSPDSNLSATLERLSSRIGEVLNRLECRPVSQPDALEHVRAPVPAWMPSSLNAGATNHSRYTHTHTHTHTVYIHYHALSYALLWFLHHSGG